MTGALTRKLNTLAAGASAAETKSLLDEADADCADAAQQIVKVEQEIRHFPCVLRVQSCAANVVTFAATT